MNIIFILQNLKVVKMDIGSKIREIRNKKNITIVQLCEGTGLSKGFISSLENNNTSPSINTLQTIANFLEVPLAYLLLEKQHYMSVVRKDKRKIVITNENTMRVEFLGEKSGLRMLKVELDTGCSMGEGKPHAHEGVECHLVLQGKVLAKQGEDSEVLEQGDSFTWNGCVPHVVINIGEEPAIILISIYTGIESQDLI
jgi:transcriptional regulator with XRE-family HTH domain